ncbi:orexin receptor type 2 [Trichonephila clavipes]|nr:orexin receptor type 2 [Trichonephila clavipes]
MYGPIHPSEFNHHTPPKIICLLELLPLSVAWPSPLLYVLFETRKAIHNYLAVLNISRHSHTFACGAVIAGTGSGLRLLEGDFPFLPEPLHRDGSHFHEFNTFFNSSSSLEILDLTYDVSNEPNQSSMNNGTPSCSNEYCVSDEDYLAMIQDYIFPTPLEWILIAAHILVFVVGLVGNALVCVSVYKNHTMRTVTNYFIVNLALADFLVILFCLPPTVLWDVTETWFFGKVTYINGRQLVIGYFASDNHTSRNNLDIVSCIHLTSCLLTLHFEPPNFELLSSDEGKSFARNRAGASRIFNFIGRHWS